MTVPAQKSAKLTDLEARFVQEYLADLNASAACLRAGYRTRYPSTLGSQIKARPHVQAALALAMEVRARRAEISADWVLANLKEVAERCLQAVMVTKRGIQVEEDGQGVWAFDASGAIRSLELIGKHRGMFKEQVDHTVKGSLSHQHLLCPRSEEILGMLTGGRGEGLAEDSTGGIASGISGEPTGGQAEKLPGGQAEKITGKPTGGPIGGPDDPA